MRVQDVMTRHVETMNRQENAQVAFDSMKLKGIRHLVVKNDSELVGGALEARPRVPPISTTSARSVAWPS